MVTTNAAGDISRPSATSLYAAIDHLGSVRALTDDSGQVVSQQSYDSYGGPQTSIDGVSPQPYRFNGREYDQATGLYNYRSREYDANAGRFLQEDRIWAGSRDLNFYRYVKNNPVRNRDPSGESELLEFACTNSFAVSAAVTVGAGAATGFATVFVPIVAALNGPAAAKQKQTDILNVVKVLIKVQDVTTTYGLLCGASDAGLSPPLIAAVVISDLALSYFAITNLDQLFK